MADYAVWAAIQAAKSGLSANAGLKAFQAGGGSIRRATWLRVYAEVKSSLADQVDEISRPLNRKPTGDEINVFSAVKATGYMQHVDIYVREKETGLVYARPYSIRTEDLMTRADVIETALSRFQDHADAYGEVVLGAAYVSTYIFAPGAK